MRMITYSQACCLVYNYTVSPANEALAVQQIETAGLTPVYKEEDGFLEPSAIGKEKQAANPFKYLSYPKQLATDTEPEHASIMESASNVSSVGRQTLTKRIGLKYLESISNRTDPHNDTLFLQEIVTLAKLQELINDHFGTDLTKSKVHSWVKSSGIWGRLGRYRDIQSEDNTRRPRGYLVYLMRSEYRGSLPRLMSQDIPHFVLANSMTTYGYARKSEGSSKVTNATALPI